MAQLPPELRVEIQQVDGKYLAVTQRANGQEIDRHVFEHDPEKLIHVEPRWMLEKGAREPGQALRAEVDAADRPPDDQLLVTYGQRLYGCLFGDGAKLQSFFEFNDAYRRQARLTLCLHPSAAALEKYQQALHILQQVGMVREAENNRRHIARVREKMGG